MKRAICLFTALIVQAAVLNAQNLSLSTVVIDPGHGGHDAGAVSKDKKTYEKNLVLDISKRLSEKIKAKYPDVKVILTRSTDVYVELGERARIANRANADLFISVHINASAKTAPNGYSVHLLGQSSKPDRDLFAYNMDVCRRENEVIRLEDDYSTKYEEYDPDDPESMIFLMLMQNAYLEQSLIFAQTVQSHLKGGPIRADRGIWQDPFLVLWKTSMPAALVELGFISNPDDLNILRQSDQRDKIADSLLAAFSEYKKQYEASIN